MAVFKRKLKGGKVSWCFVIDCPGSSRQNRKQAKEAGFETKAAAEAAEAERRVLEQKRYELEQAGLPKVPLPKTLADLLQEFFKEHAERKLAPKTIERYREQAGYLCKDLLALPITDIKPLHLAKEWNRLLESGGRRRGSGERAHSPPRPYGTSRASFRAHSHERSVGAYFRRILSRKVNRRPLNARSVSP